MNGTLNKFVIVRGDEARVPFSDMAFGFCLGRRGGDLLVQPTAETLKEALVEADGFFFYGHGDKGGALHLTPTERFRQLDLEEVISRRAALGKPRLEVAEVRACYSGSKGEYINRWLDLAEVVHCFPDVTASAAPPFIHPMHTYRKPIDYDPGRLGFWSRFSRSR